MVLSRPFLRAVDWTKEERASFELFCNSSCGKKLFEFLRQLVANTTFKAVYQNSVSANGHARGMQDLLTALYKLRVFPEEESTQADVLEEAEPRMRSGTNDSWRPPFGGRGAIG